MMKELETVRLLMEPLLVVLLSKPPISCYVPGDI